MIATAVANAEKEAAAAAVAIVVTTAAIVVAGIETYLQK